MSECNRQSTIMSGASPIIAWDPSYTSNFHAFLDVICYLIEIDHDFVYLLNSKKVGKQT